MKPMGDPRLTDEFVNGRTTGTSETSITDCVAMQVLADVYSETEMAEMLDVSPSTAHRHARNKCKTHSPDGVLNDEAAMTKYECMAARLLEKSGWSRAELKMVFEVGKTTLGIHLDAKCASHAPDPETIPEFDYDRVVNGD